MNTKRVGSSACCTTSKRAMPGSCTLARAFANVAALNASMHSGFTRTWMWTTSMDGTTTAGRRRALEFLQRVRHRLGNFLQLLVGVHRGNGGPNEIFAHGHGRRDRHDRENALF